MGQHKRSRPKQPHDGSVAQTSPQTLLRAAGLKATPHRLQLLSVLRSSPAPLPLKALHSCFKPGAVNIVTLYRNLEAFAGAGLVEEVRITGEETPRYEYAREHHHHAVCDNCDKVADLPGCGYEKIFVPGTAEFPIIHGHNIEFRGLCQNCVSK